MASDGHVIEYTVSPDHGERAVRACLAAQQVRPPSRLQRVGTSVGLGLLLLLSLGWWIAFGFHCVCQVGSWLIIAMVLLAQLFERQAHRHIQGGIEESVRALGSSLVRWTLGESGMSATSVVGPREVPWADVKDAYLSHGIWVITQRSRQVTVIPVEAFTESAERFFLARLRAAGARVQMPDALRESYDDGPA